MPGHTPGYPIDKAGQIPKPSFFCQGHGFITGRRIGNRWHIVDLIGGHTQKVADQGFHFTDFDAGIAADHGIQRQSPFNGPFSQAADKGPLFFIHILIF